MKYLAFIIALAFAYPNIGSAAQKKPGDSCDIEDFATIENSAVRSKLLRENPWNQLSLSTLTREEIARDSDGHTKYYDDIFKKGGKVFSLKAPRMKPGEEFDFYSFTIKQTAELTASFVANAQGELVTNDKNNVPLSNFKLTVYDQMKGEEISYVLLSKDKSRCLAVSCATDPIDAKWNDGSQIYMAMLTSDLKLFYLYGSQFKPGEKVSLTFKMGNKEFSEDFIASSQGTFFTILNHDMLGETGGTGRIRASKASTGESIALEYLWGEDLTRDFRAKKSGRA